MIDQFTEKQIKTIAKRAADLFLNSKEMLTIDADFFENRFFQSQKGVFIEIGTDKETISSLGNLKAGTNLLENISFVVFHTLASLDEEALEKLKQNEYHLRVWIIEDFEQVNQFDTERFFDKLIIQRPGIIINHDKDNSYCFLPKVWSEIFDPSTIMEKLAEHAGLNNEDWKDPENTIIIFKSTPLLI